MNDFLDQRVQEVPDRASEVFRVWFRAVGCRRREEEKVEDLRERGEEFRDDAEDLSTIRWSEVRRRDGCERGKDLEVCVEGVG